MCDKDKMNNCNCISEILKRIIHLQKNSYKNCRHEGCSKPFLGPELLECYNTRPISFYSCQTGELISIDESTIFRLESIDDCCCTCRILNFTDGTYTTTNNFFTININCVCAIKCHNDVNIAI